MAGQKIFLKDNTTIDDFISHQLWIFSFPMCRDGKIVQNFIIF